MIEVVNIKKKLATITEPWSPKIVGQVNDCHVKLVKLQGEFIWHHHDDEDEMFLVIEGTLQMKLRDRELTIEPGEFIVIPRGVEHLPVADEDVHVMLFEPVGTVNTGNVTNERTVENVERI